MSIRAARVLGWGAAGAAVLAFAALAMGADRGLTDPNDTPGILDVHRVVFEDLRGEAPAWTVITASGWRIGPLWDRGYVFVELDTMGREPADYYALVRSDGNALRGELYRVVTRRGRHDARVADLTVWRKGPASVSVKVPLKLMAFGANRVDYRWWVVTTLTGTKCPSTCVDRVPDEGSVQAWLPGRSPTPTPSPSVSPIPSVSPSGS